MPDGWGKHFPSRNVAVVSADLPKVDSEHWVLLRTDAHHDNPDCDHDLERMHLEQAVERNASIIDAGDVFCAMQGKYDKRADKSKLREEHRHGPYLDALVDTAADFYAPFAANWVVLGRGNHEQAIKNRHETDLTERLSARLSTGGNVVQAGGYTGWVRFDLNSHGRRVPVRLWYGHGWGGGGPVTLGTIQAANRMPMQIEGADVLFTGHVHEAVYAEKVRAFINGQDEVEHRTLHCVIGATYKDEYRDGYSGWHVETGKAPKPTGAWWLRLGMDRWRKGGRQRLRPTIELRRAT